MDSRTGVRWVIGIGFLVMVVGLVAADKDRNTIATRLSGLEETTATIQTPASGEFKGTISEDGTSIKYEETWRNLSSTITQSHIHFGRPGLTRGHRALAVLQPSRGHQAAGSSHTDTSAVPDHEPRDHHRHAHRGRRSGVACRGWRPQPGDRHRSPGVRGDGEGDPDGLGLRERAFGGSSLG